MSVAAVSGPDRTATRPAGSCGKQCIAKIACDVLQPALHDHLRGAGGELLLARLEDQAHPPGQLTAASSSARASPAPSRTVVCTSWPQAWQTLGTVDR